jgi:hypothetical protein
MWIGDAVSTLCSDGWQLIILASSTKQFAENIVQIGVRDRRDHAAVRVQSSIACSSFT